MAAHHQRKTGVIHMVINIAALLDKAQVIHRLPSDYKLALVMGISHSSLTSYRQGKTLPDARVISKLCELTGDDAAVLLAQIEEKRAKTDEARTLWHMVAQRLQSGAAAAIFSVLFVLGVGVGLPMDAQASTPVTHKSTPYTSWNMSGLAQALRRLWSPLVIYLRALWLGGHHVSCTASIATA